MNQEKVEELVFANAQAVSSLLSVTTQTSKDVDKLIKHMDEVLPFRGKIHNLDERVNKLEDKVNINKKDIDVIYTMAKYPKITLIFLGFIYILTIKEFRNPILDIVKIIL